MRCCVLLLGHYATELWAAESLIRVENWDLKKDNEGIQVYTGTVHGSAYAAVRTVTVVEEVKLASMVALLMDSEACPRWVDKCANSYVYDRISDTELLVYTHNDLPFPVKDRDILSHVLWFQDPKSLAVQMTSQATSGILGEMQGKLRLTETYISWKFRPLADGSVEVTNEAHINPGSALPGWVTNMLLVNTPFETLKGFRGEVTKVKYEEAKLEFIVEPG